MTAMTPTERRVVTTGAQFLATHDVDPRGTFWLNLSAFRTDCRDTWYMARDLAEALPERANDCGCATCDEDRRAARLAVDGNWPAYLSRPMIVCDLCGNKRCPHAEDHNWRCTGSNKPGQAPERVA